MALEGRDLNDSQILQGTIQETGDNGRVRYKTILPSGRDLVSEWMNPDDMQGKTVITWCDHVRQQVQVDVEEERAARKRLALEEVAENSEESTASSPESIEESSAMAHAVAQRDKWLLVAQAAEEEVVQWKLKRKKARLEHENWEKIVNSLRGELDE